MRSILTRTYYALETMPWIFPDSADSYLALVKAIDRKAFAVHYDPVNMINCPQRLFDNAAPDPEFTAKLLGCIDPVPSMSKISGHRWSDRGASGECRRPEPARSTTPRCSANWRSWTRRSR